MGMRMRMRMRMTASFPMRHWIGIVCLLLLAWGLRLCCLEGVPPGWRDDELINIHALSGEVLEGRFPLYFTGASGHEPLYHHLHAGVHAVLGFNTLSAHILSVFLGTLTVALTYRLSRRIWGHVVGMAAALALATSFWSLMYSRIALRHISLPVLALWAVYLLFPPRHKRGGVGGGLLLGVVVGLSLYTYPAARLLPVLLVLFGGYLALVHRETFRRCWRGLLLALIVAGVVALPLAAAIIQGRSDAASEGIGADARLAELAVPLRALRAGDPRPLLENIWTTLGMFHATGDPEWLYNIAGRPVFHPLGGLLLWAGVLLCGWRWREPRSALLLLWLGLGLLPTFVSVPPASLSHTILAQPVVYLLPVLALVRVGRWLEARWSRLPATGLLLLLFLASHAARDLRDYFVVWPWQGMTRFLYRADYRAAARYLDARPELTDVAVGSGLMGPWDRLALEVDLGREDVAARLFNPERALVWTADDGPTTVLLTAWPQPLPLVDGWLGSPEAIAPHLTRWSASAPPDLFSLASTPVARFTNGLELTHARRVEGEDVVLLTVWRVATPLAFDPPVEIVANPPPPGVYSGPRLAVFSHLLAADGTFLAGDDGLWVDSLTLRPGDRFAQVQRLALPPDGSGGPYVVELGLYDPLDGQRWAVVESESGAASASDRLLLPLASLEETRDTVR